MNRHLIILLRGLVCCLLLASVAQTTQAYTERDLLQRCAQSREHLRGLLAADQSWVSFPDYKDRAAWDSLLGEEGKRQLVMAGEKLLDYKWNLIRATDYLEYGRSGDISVMERPYFENRTALGTLMMAELAEGKGRFTDQLLNGVFYSCEMTTWAVSAHLKYQVPRCVLPDHRTPLIDIAAADYASLLSWTYHFFRKEFDHINPVISIRLRQVLEERALKAYMKKDEWWMATKEWKPGDVINNWNPWCNANMLQCFLLLEDDPERLSEAVWKSVKSVDKFLNFVSTDGACEEGSTYWGHAAGKLLDYLQLLHDATGGRLSIFNDPMVRRMGEYISRTYVGNGWAVNFADASPRFAGNPPLIYRYGKETGSEELMKFAAFLAEDRGVSIVPERGDVYRALQAILCRKELENTEPRHEKEACTWYPETQVCYLTNHAGWFLAAKGGHNNESHNHNDVGTFSLYIHGKPVLIDVGVGTYTRQTFSKERYSIWTMQSDYHNLPLINGVSQHQGAEFKATSPTCRPERATVSFDIASAYPDSAAVKKWIRSYELKTEKLTIRDQFSFRKACSPNSLHFMTCGNVNLSVPGKIKVDSDGESVTMEYPGTMEASAEFIPLTDPKLQSVWGDSVCRIVLTDKTLKTKGEYNIKIY